MQFWSVFAIFPNASVQAHQANHMLQESRTTLAKTKYVAIKKKKKKALLISGSSHQKLEPTSLNVCFASSSSELLR